MVSNMYEVQLFPSNNTLQFHLEQSSWSSYPGPPPKEIFYSSVSTVRELQTCDEIWFSHQPCQPWMEVWGKVWLTLVCELETVTLILRLLSHDFQGALDIHRYSGTPWHVYYGYGGLELVLKRVLHLFLSCFQPVECINSNAFSSSTLTPWHQHYP